MNFRNVKGLNFEERRSATGRVEGTCDQEIIAVLLNNDDNQMAGVR